MVKLHNGYCRVEIEKLSPLLSIETLWDRKEGIDTVTFSIRSKKELVFPRVVLKLMVPASGVYYRWTPKLNLIKALNADWYQNLYLTNGFTGAPVECLISVNDKNQYTFGLSDTLHTIGLQCIPIEETAEYAAVITLFEQNEVQGTDYKLEVRIDTRDVPYYKSLSDLSVWWADMDLNHPAAVPSDAMEPMYSTWYSFHQGVSENLLLEQCKRAKELGCKSLLIDDGWQTDDESRGYAYCGDWKPAHNKIPDMGAFVEKVHSMGMKVIPWYSVPFIGRQSENFESFRDMLIDPKADREWHVLDPRYPKVRELIISTYEKALKDWKLDGFKLDFVDEFVVAPCSEKHKDSRRDFESVTDAVKCLMKDCINRLKVVRPDVLLEFRQTYNGPLMRSFGNIFRAVDCPLDAVENHVRVTDIRLIVGNSAVHSDMLMWNLQDTAENAALQIINILFSVPQISMKLEELPQDHRKMLAYYCRMWKKYQNAFIKGDFIPLNPQCRYDVVMGTCSDRFACTYHSQKLVSVMSSHKHLLFVNGSGTDHLMLEWDGPEQDYERTVCDCTGEILEQEISAMKKGIIYYLVPPSGTLELISHP